MAFGQYVNLDFDQIKTSIKDYLKSNTNFTDYDFEGSNLSIIIDALAYNTYITSYNTNMAANECFLDSSTLRENVVALVWNIGYVPDLVDHLVQRFLSLLVESLKPLRKQFVWNCLQWWYIKCKFYFFNSRRYYRSCNKWVQYLTILKFMKDLWLLKILQSIRQNLINVIFIKFILDTSTIRVKVKPSESSHRLLHETNDNIVGVTSTSSYLLQEVEDERYELIFGDNVIAKSYQMTIILQFLIL